MFDKEFSMTPIKLTMAMLIVIFVFWELIPFFKKEILPKEYLLVGGLLSGFLGGLSGHQGALRSAFLMKCDLTKEGFIASGVVIACLVDFSRIMVYMSYLVKTNIQDYSQVLVCAVLSAFTGVFLASRLMKKITFNPV